jgi:hypothetical protein
MWPERVVAPIVAGSLLLRVSVKLQYKIWVVHRVGEGGGSHLTPIKHATSERPTDGLCTTTFLQVCNALTDGEPLDQKYWRTRYP